jgi:hypothetical protein
MKSTPELEQKLKDLASQGLLEREVKNNIYMKLFYRGAGPLVSPKWNIQIYNSGSVVCTDGLVLQDLIAGKLKPPNDSLELIQIDDAGMGFPLCGIMVGICCSRAHRLVTDVVPVTFFQEPNFSKKNYVKDYTDRGFALLVREFNPSPQTHRVEICSGYINKSLKGLLREKGFDVRAVEIKGVLQDNLERLFNEHVEKETGVSGLAYDPKDLSRQELCSQYYRALNWGKRNAPHLLKSGWGSIMQEGDQK